MQQQECEIVTFGMKLTRRSRRSQLLHVHKFFAGKKQPDQLSDTYTAATYHRLGSSGGKLGESNRTIIFF